MSFQGGDVAFARVLGPVQVVTASGRSLDLPSASQRRLVALLATEAPRSLRADRGFLHLGLLPSAQVAIIESALEVIGEGDAATRARLLALAFVATMEARFADAEELMHKAADAAVAMGAAVFAVFAGQAAALATIAGHHSELPPNVVQVIEAGPVQPTSALAHAIIRIVSVTAWGCEIMITCDPSTSAMWVFARWAMERTTSAPVGTRREPG